MGHENGGWMNSDQRDAMKDVAESADENVKSSPAESETFTGCVYGKLVGDTYVKTDDVMQHEFSKETRRCVYCGESYAQAYMSTGWLCPKREKK